MKRIAYGTILLALYALLFGFGGWALFCIGRNPFSTHKAETCYEKPFTIFAPKESNNVNE